MKFIVVIPARYSSKRLPGKPIVNIGKLPMIVRTYNQCNKVVNKNKIFVATDNFKIKKVCDKYNIKTIMTSSKCLTGTDRVAEVAKKIKCDFYINVQGDEPFFYPNDLKKLIKEALKNPNQIINGYSEIKDKKLFYNSSIPKVVFDSQKYLLYMSRGPIPSNKKISFKKGWRQICAYSFPRKALKNFTKQKIKTKLESIEDIEILRFIENGYKVKMIKMSNKSLAVDNKDDLAKAKIYLKYKKL
ncbi:3-deoxy-manno-octulosonate cytidylyltransferase [Candidatus Pelagibacter bacterium]|nr:3-deoxy-manno-octulosonate cytidylyltransferase [Candidatus Pelagibacter bacterium]